MAGSDPIASSLVEILADTSKFGDTLTKNVDAAARTASESASKIFTAGMDAGASTASDAFGAVLVEGLSAAGVEAADAFGDALILSADAAASAAADSAAGLFAEGLDAGAAAASESFGVIVSEGMSAAGAEAGDAFAGSFDIAVTAAGEEGAVASSGAFRRFFLGEMSSSGAEGADELSRGLLPTCLLIGEKAAGAVVEGFRKAGAQFLGAGAEAGKKIGEGVASTTTGVFSSLGSVAAEAFATVGKAAAVGTVALTGFGVKSAGDLQQTQIAFTQLTGSAKNAQETITQLQAFAASTPFEFKDVSQASAKLLAVGDAAGITRQNLIPVLTTIGDVGSAFGVSGDQINGAVNALAQIAGAGKFDLGNLNQISDNLGGFPARAVLAQQAAQAWGVSTQEALDRISSGALPAQEGIQLLLKGMAAYPGAAGGMAKQSESLNGVLSTFADTARNSLSNAFTPAIPAITATLNSLVPVMQSALGKLGPVISETLVALLPLVGQAIDAFATLLQPIIPIFAQIAPAISAAFKTLTPLLSQLFTALAPLAGPLNNLIVLFSQLLVSALTPLIPVIVQITNPAIWAPLVEAFFQIFQALQPLIPVLAGAFLKTLMAILPVLPQLIDALLQLALALVPLIGPFSQVVVFLSQFLTNAINAGALQPLVVIVQALAVGIRILAPILGPFVAGWLLWVGSGALVTVLTGAIASLNAVILANPFVAIGVAIVAVVGGFVLLYKHSQLVRDIVAEVWNVFKGIGEFIVNVYVQAWDLLTSAVQNVIDFFSRMPAEIGAALDQVGAFFVNLWHGVEAGATAIVDFFATLPGLILDELLALPGQLLDLFVTALGDVLRGIGIIIGLIIAAVVELVRGIIFAVTELPGLLLDLFVKGWNAAYEAVVSAGTAIVNFVIQLGKDIINALIALPGEVADLFVSLWNLAYAAFEKGWNAVVGFVTTFPGKAVNALKELSIQMAGFFVKLWDDLSQKASDGVDKVIKWFKGIPGALTNLGVDLLKSGEDMIKAIFDGFAKAPQVGLGIAKAVVNGIVDGINWAIGKINEGLTSIRIPGTDIHVPGISTIPRWTAAGGIFDSPTVIGVGEAGREAVIPLTNPARAVALAQQSGLLDVLARAGGQTPGQVINMTVNTPAANPVVVAQQVLGQLARKAA